MRSVVVALFAAGLAAGCGDDAPSTEEATAEVCAARGEVDSVITEVERLDPTDLDQLADAREQIADDLDELAAAGQELAESAWDDVESAAEDVRDTIDDIDADSTFREANDQLSEARDQLAAAWEDFTSGVDCP
jgi:ABC-type transporter Mla subunit MlaD